MAFQEDYAAALANRGITVDPSVVPDRDTLGQAFSNIQVYLSDLDPALRDGFDDSSLDFRVCSVLAAPEINVAPEISGILEAFDNTPGMRLSELVQAGKECLDEVVDGQV